MALKPPFIKGWQACNKRSATQVHNFGRACRCMKRNPYGFGNLVEPHSEPHLCAVCGREFVE